MTRNQTDFINNLGIGAFLFLSIREFCSLIQYVLRNIFIITKTEPKLILWLPEVSGFILFIILLLWIINKYNKPLEINTRKTLIKSIIIFFGFIILQFLFSFFGTSYLINNYLEAFEVYNNVRKEDDFTPVVISFIPISKYLFFGILLLIKSKTSSKRI